jgi:hypothetical protein
MMFLVIEFRSRQSMRDPLILRKPAIITSEKVDLVVPYFRQPFSRGGLDVFL